jgi:hypothetical protein
LTIGGLTKVRPGLGMVSTECSTEKFTSRHLPSKNDSAHYAFASIFKAVTIGCSKLTESLHSIMNTRVQDGFVNTPQNRLNDKQKLIRSLE